MRNGLGGKDSARAASGDTGMKQTERMTDETVLSGRDGVRRRRRPSVGGVIVVNENRIAIGVVAASVSPIKRAAAHYYGERRSQSAAYQTFTDGAEPHRSGM